MGILGQGRPGGRGDQAKGAWRLESLGIHFKHFQVPGAALGAGSAEGRRQRRFHRGAWVQEFPAWFVSGTCLQWGLIHPQHLLYPPAVTASPAGPLRTSDWVVLNCSFSRPEFPASVQWFRGPGRAPVQKSPHHHLEGSFLFLPRVSRADSGLWGCILTYSDGFRVSSTYDLTVLGNAARLPSHWTARPLLPSPPLPLTCGSPKKVLRSRTPPLLILDLAVRCPPFSLFAAFSRG